MNNKIEHEVFYETPVWQRVEDVNFIEIKEGDSDIVLYKDNCRSELEKNAKSKYWWLREKWAEKGLPKESIEYKFGDSKISVFNFDREMTVNQLSELNYAIEKITKIKNGELLKKLDFILIDDERKTNPHDGSEQNGTIYDNIMHLYSAVLDNNSHRVEGVSNLIGTIIHEAAHFFDIELTREWRDKFGWKKHFEQSIKKPSGGYSVWEYMGDKDRLISDYAGIEIEDDIAESMVAALEKPYLLDKERLDYLKEYICYEKSVECNVDQRKNEDIQLPNKKVITYKVKKRPTIRTVK